MGSSLSSSGLGSLAQSARKKQLGQARGILLFIGIITILLNGFLFANAPKEVRETLDKEVQQVRLQGGFVPAEELRAAEERLLRFCYLIYGGTIVLGAVFVICGILVYQFPVPTTVLSLILYLGGNAVFAVLAPASLARGLIIKIIIVVALVKAIQSAIAYQKERDTPIEMEPAV